MVTLLLIATALAALPPSSAIECQPLPARLQVRLTFSTPAAAPAETAIRQAVEEVWTPSGLQFAWTSAPGADFWIAVVHGMTTVAGRAPLGRIQFYAGRPQPMARISLEASRDWSQRYQERLLHITLNPLVRSQIDDPAVLGRVMGYASAHELGHFLLASAAHESAGIMREAYRNSTAAFEPGSWRLDDKSRALVSQRMSEDCRRVAARNAAR